MAKNPAPPEQPAPAAKTASEKATGFSMKKMITIGIPLFLVQVVLIYFVVTKFLSPASGSAGDHSAAKKGESEHAAAASDEEVTQNIHIVKDLIVNPAGTNGTRFLLTTVGFSVTTPEAKLELENKDMQVRDVLNTILTSKDLAELSGAAERESSAYGDYSKGRRACETRSAHQSLFQQIHHPVGVAAVPDMLSQQEVDSLLSDISTGNVEASDQPQSKQAPICLRFPASASALEIAAALLPIGA